MDLCSTAHTSTRTAANDCGLQPFATSWNIRKFKSLCKLHGTEALRTELKRWNAVGLALDPAATCHFGILLFSRVVCLALRGLERAMN